MSHMDVRCGLPHRITGERTKFGLCVHATVSQLIGAACFEHGCYAVLSQDMYEHCLLLDLRPAGSRQKWVPAPEGAPSTGLLRPQGLGANQIRQGGSVRRPLSDLTGGLFNLGIHMVIHS